MVFGRYLDRNRIRRVEGLRGLTKLEELHLSEQRLSADHTSLGDAKVGASMNTNGNDVPGLWLGDADDWSDIARSLRVISLSGNGITDITPLSQLQRVQNVNLSNNRIASPESILEMCNGQIRLEVLNLTGNPAMTAVAKMRDHIILSTHMLRKCVCAFTFGHYK
jgi:Leucine-rich repeat (LRR) protein